MSELLKALFTAFIVVFISELGDKTQLSTMLMASKSVHPKVVFIGSSLALILSSALAVCFGLYLKKFIPEEFIRYGGALVFVTVGLLMLFDN